MKDVKDLTTAEIVTALQQTRSPLCAEAAARIAKLEADVVELKCERDNFVNACAGNRAEWATKLIEENTSVFGCVGELLNLANHLVIDLWTYRNYARRIEMGTPHEEAFEEIWPEGHPHPVIRVDEAQDLIKRLLPQLSRLVTPPACDADEIDPSGHSVPAY